MGNGPPVRVRELQFTLLLIGCFVVFFSLQQLLKRAPEVNLSLPEPVAQSGCRLQPLSAEEAAEERRILQTTAWPETPQLPEPFDLRPSSDPANSSFTIVSERKEWRVGDQLTVSVQMRDFTGRPKRSGGDLLMSRLHSPELGAAVVGQVQDHLNGSYSAVFPLLWNGTAHVEVKLVHSSEAITVLRRLTAEHPDRVYFQSDFRSGSLSERTNCSICLPQPLPVCNYTDLTTGEPWFCYKPKQLSCDTRVSHIRGGFIQNITEDEQTLFQEGVNVKVSIKASGPSSVNVLPNSEPRSSVVRAAGFYYRGAWQALSGPRVRHDWDQSRTRACLRNKAVHMFGDSTLRQWFLEILNRVPGLQNFILGHAVRGPYIAIDITNNIYMSFDHHSVPVHSPNLAKPRDLRSIANELERVPGGPQTVVLFTVWSHLTIYSVEFHLRRLLIIRRAVKRLLSRAPETRVIIRTANPKETNLYALLTNSDWYCLQRDRVLREVFKGLDVRLVDAWEMVQAHSLPNLLHPQPPIINNMVDTFLSYIC